MSKDTLEYEQANAPCPICNGEMPCYCEVPPIDYEADAEARNRVDMPHEDEPA